jgi:hypothetical protein
MFLKIKKLVAIGAVLILVAAWFTSGHLENTYVNYPRVPNAETGRIVPYATKGIVVYITERQQRVLSWLTWIEIGSGMIAAAVLLIHRGDPFRSEN